MPCSSWALLKRSSTSILRISGAHRRTSHLHAYSSSPSAAAAAGAGYGDKPPGPSQPHRDLRPFLTAVTGILASVSGLVLWLASSPELSSSFDSPPKNDTKLECSSQDTPQERNTRCLFGDAYRRRVFFNYEKRIRLRSPPEKVFEYFASYRNTEGEVFMTPSDLMRAVIPVFPPSESNRIREGYLRGEHQPDELHCSPSTLFMLFDTNNDGLISFSEYIFFVTLLSIPESSFSAAFKMFDLDHNGEIDRVEFKKVMGLMRSYNRQGASHSDGLRTGLKVGKLIENGGLVEYFFGKDETGCLQHEKFVGFLRQLHDEIVRLEFAHYDCKLRGTILAKDFALSMVASAEGKHINKFLDSVDKLSDEPHLRDIRITMEEFKAFAELRDRLQPLALAMFGYQKVNGPLTKQDFQRAASHVCGIYLTDNVVDIIFHVFDMNCDGSLSAEEFLKALQGRERHVHQTTSAGGVVGLTSRSWLNL